MKRRWCLKCKELKVIYSTTHNKYNRDKKPFRCMNCDAKYTYKQIGAVKSKQQGYQPKNPERVKALSKALFQQCADIMNNNRKLLKNKEMN